MLGRRHRSSGASEKVRVERRFRGSPSVKVMAEARLLRGVSLGCGGDGSSSMLISGGFILAWEDRKLPAFQTWRLGDVVVMLCCCFVVGESLNAARDGRKGSRGARKRIKIKTCNTIQGCKIRQYNTIHGQAKQYTIN
jgi:hypothetical protein